MQSVWNHALTFKLSGGLLKSVFSDGDTPQPMVVVHSTWMEPPNALYGAYLEFHDASDEFHQKIRSWIHEKRGAPGAIAPKES